MVSLFKKGLISVIALCSTFVALAQIGIGTATPHPSAALDINFTSRGLLLPRVALSSTTDNTTIPQPAISLLVYNTNNNMTGGNGTGVYYNSGSQASPQWIRLQTQGGSGAWNITGNAGTNPATNFIGTTNSSALVFRTNNIQSGRIDPALRSYFFGENAGINNTGLGNIGFGHGALRSNTNRGGLVAIGDSALYANGTGVTNSTQANFNTAVGSRALRNNTTGYGNTAVGARALLANTNGFLNTAFGWDALRSNNAGDSNVAIGARALFANTTGNSNTAIGTDALAANTTASYNVAIGNEALNSNTAGQHNTAIGMQAMLLSNGSFNTAVGNFAGRTNGAGERNTAIGFAAMDGINSPSGTPSDNVAVGASALTNISAGSSNTAVGNGALRDLTTGGGNTAVGWIAGDNITSGSNNTLVGHNIFIPGGSSGITNAIAIGHDVNISQSNTVRIGNTSITSIGGQVAFTATSDMRVKTHVREDVPGLDFVLRLRPVSYFMHRNADDAGNLAYSSWENTMQQSLGGQRHIGLLAQEVYRAAEAVNFDFDGVELPGGPDGYYSLRYALLTVPLIKAVQEQQQQIDELLQKAQRLKLLLDKQLEQQGKTTIEKRVNENN